MARSMYNRDIPNGTAYTRIPEEDGPSFREDQDQRHSEGQKAGQPPRGSGHDAQSRRPPPSWEEKGASWLSGILRSLHLDDLDTGDILLLLILLFLFIDGDDLELMITLGLLLLLGLGGKSEKESS